MHILHIMAARSLGGAETYATDVMLSLHAAGVRQTIVMAPDAPRMAELRAAGLTIDDRVLAIRFAPLQRWRLNHLIRQIQPDVIHCWMRRAASLVSVPPCHRGKPIIGWFGGYYDPARFRRCTHFVGVTKDIVAHMVRRGVPESTAFFIPTFPDIAAIPALDRAALATPPEAKILLTLSRLHPKKGLDVFLQSLVDLPDCVAWLAGDGPLREELETLAVRLGIKDRVRFLGWRTDRAALLRAADVCVLPSRYEPFGTVILEAWAAHTPLVACASAGPAAHVDDGVTGLLTPIDNVSALTAALRRALDDAVLRQNLIAQGYAAYINGYTREAVTRQWIAFYRNRMDS